MFSKLVGILFEQVQGCILLEGNMCSFNPTLKYGIESID